MPLQLNEFYGEEKSIQRSYDFLVTIVNDNTNSYLPDGEEMPEIKEWHVRNITPPSYEFKKEIQYHGPYPFSYPVLENDGFEVAITFEEDNKGTIAKWIDWMQRRIINKNGKYIPPATNRLTGIFCDVMKYENKKRTIINTFYYSNCYFLRASNPTYDYGTNEAIRREVTLGCDFAYYIKNNKVVIR